MGEACPPVRPSTLRRSIASQRCPDHLTCDEALIRPIGRAVVRLDTLRHRLIVAGARPRGDLGIEPECSVSEPSRRSDRRLSIRSDGIDQSCARRSFLDSVAKGIDQKSLRRIGITCVAPHDRGVMEDRSPAVLLSIPEGRALYSVDLRIGTCVQCRRSRCSIQLR